MPSAIASMLVFHPKQIFFSQILKPLQIQFIMEAETESPLNAESQTEAMFYF